MMKRVFIVGTARSGTTLLQSIFGSHKSIYTFPESHFFSKTIPKEKLLRFIHRINAHHKNHVKNFLLQENKCHLYQDYSGCTFKMNSWARYLITTIDRMCEEEGKMIWLEKTPMHLYFIDLIERNCNHAFFIHLIREPIANIAAVYHVSKKYPEQFFQNTVSKAIKRYKKEIRISEKYLNNSNHAHVHYEALVENPRLVLDSLCERLGIAFDPAMLNYKQSVDKIISSGEHWKSENKGQLQIRDKIRQRVNEQELSQIKKAIPTINSKLLSYYAKP